MMDGFFLYTVDPTADEPIMLIDGHIGFDEVEGFGVMGDLFQKELLQLDTLGKSRIQVWINSPGGVVADGYSIYNAILKSKTKVDTYCTGMAASIAGVIFQAGRSRYMADYSWLMYHNPFGGDDDDALMTITESLAKMVSERTGKSVDEIKAIMKKETYIMADECKQTGLCDVVELSADQNKKRVSAASSAKAFLKVASEITNNLLPQNFKNNNDMKVIANKLNLNESASEASIVAEVEKIQNKATALEGTIATHLETIKNKDSEIEKKQKQLDDMQKECDALKAEIKQMKEQAKNEEEAAKAKAAEEEAAKAKNLISAFVKAGAVKNDEKVIKEWEENAKVLGLEKVKNMLESLPVNRKAVKIEDVQNSGEQVKYSFAGAMVKITNSKKERVTY